MSCPASFFLFLVGFSLLLSANYPLVIAVLNSTEEADNAVNITSAPQSWEIIRKEDLCAWCQAILSAFKQQIKEDRGTFKAGLVLSCAIARLNEEMNHPGKLSDCQKSISSEAIAKIDRTHIDELCAEQKLCEATGNNSTAAEAAHTTPIDEGLGTGNSSESGGGVNKTTRAI